MGGVGVRPLEGGGEEFIGGFRSYCGHVRSGMEWNAESVATSLIGDSNERDERAHLGLIGST